MNFFEFFQQKIDVTNIRQKGRNITVTKTWLLFTQTAKGLRWRAMFGSDKQRLCVWPMVFYVWNRDQKCSQKCLESSFYLSFYQSVSLKCLESFFCLSFFLSKCLSYFFQSVSNSTFSLVFLFVLVFLIKCLSHS